MRAAQTHAPLPESDPVRIKRPHITAPTRSLALTKGHVLRARLRIRRFGQNTLLRAAFEALRSYRQVSMLERGTICGYRGQRLTAFQRARLLKHGIDHWPIQNVNYRLLYLKLRLIIEALFTLISKKVKTLATQDRNRYWMAEADHLEKLFQEGRTRELYSITRIYSGKRRPAGLPFLTDPKGKHLDTPEARMSE